MVTGTAFGRPYERIEPASPPVRSDVVAGAVTLVVTVLTGAPVGLLWAALAPHAQAVLVEGAYQRADPSTDAYIVADGCFSLAMALAGVVSAAVVWRMARRHGPVVVPALAAAGLAAAYVAVQVGEAVGRADVAALVGARAAEVDLPLEVAMVASIALWSALAMLTWVALSLVAFLRGRDSAEAPLADPLSSRVS